ncbi:hypothetical protein E2C01_066668 [Portunus trituberculatus]|uniref:Uncharacterized protein n=1 Tax=Portunus trituberculatus TaxID=210409 RepID=A0A5B7HVA4_PORTR|nr:hypothetical protein [Portunus trituberculatus]
MAGGRMATVTHPHLHSQCPACGMPGATVQGAQWSHGECTLGVRLPGVVLEIRSPATSQPALA